MSGDSVRIAFLRGFGRPGRDLSVLPSGHSPYDDLPAERFWRNAVASQTPETVRHLYRRRYEIGARDRIATAGSCFAQHISAALVDRGYNVLDVEPPPGGMARETARHYGYSLYSARYGNIYHARRLLQMIDEACGRFQPQSWIWERKGAFFDALRPGVEPQGLTSADEVVAHRDMHLKHVRRLIATTDVLVFTLGLTEGWVHRRSGTVYAMAPGTAAGSYDPSEHAFVNFTAGEVVEDLVQVRQRLKAFNPGLRMLFTVSPVPLVATADDRHVLQSTTYSKSVLRAACGELCARFPDVDYFPSYELIATPFSRAAFFEPNLRTVRDEGVALVMKTFFSEHPAVLESRPKAGAARKRGADGRAREALVCEEEILEALR